MSIRSVFSAPAEHDKYNLKLLLTLILILLLDFKLTLRERGRCRLQVYEQLVRMIRFNGES